MEAEAYSPAHITGFFEIHALSDDPLRRGSRGAGLSLSRGVNTKVSIRPGPEESVTIRINGEERRDARVSDFVVREYLRLTGRSFKVVVDHRLDVQIGSGFGTSGAGALGLSLAFNEALRLGLTRIEAAKIAHHAEIACRTGLGTVIAEEQGGLEVRTMPGAPGIGEVRKLPVGRDYAVLTLNFGPISTPEALTNPAYVNHINGIGGRFVKVLESEPTPERFMELSRRFTDSCGFHTGRMRRVMAEADREGYTVAMAMFGETLFSLARADRAEGLKAIFLRHAPSPRSVLESFIEEEGARLL